MTVLLGVLEIGRTGSALFSTPPSPCHRSCTGAVLDGLQPFASSLTPFDEAIGIARLEAIGVSCYACTATSPLHHPRTALAVAVRCGSVAAAEALLAAGASTDGAYPQLVELARRTNLQLAPAVAAQVVPELVQQCAAALLAVPLRGVALGEAHEAAAQLAFPQATPGGISFPACPWLLQQLLQLHGKGQIPSCAAVVWVVCNALLRCCTDQRQQSGPYDHSALNAAFAAWLSLPAAGGIAGGDLAVLLKQLCEHGLTAALPALLAQARLREQLRVEAVRPIALAEDAVAEAAALVCAAANSGCAEVLDAVLAAGGAVTLNAINSAVGRAADVRNTRALQLLLSRGRPAVPSDAAALGCPGVGANDITYVACPVYTTLDNFSGDLYLVREAGRWPACPLWLGAGQELVLAQPAGAAV